LFSRAVETRRAVNAVAIEHGEGGQLQFTGALGEILGLRSAAQKAEGAAGVEFDVGHEGRSLSSFLVLVPRSRSSFSARGENENDYENENEGAPSGRIFL
jgi:hypothetical protein